MYGDIDIEKDMLFIVTAENDESDEPYLRLFAHKEDADLWITLFLFCLPEMTNC